MTSLRRSIQSGLAGSRFSLPPSQTSIRSPLCAKREEEDQHDCREEQERWGKENATHRSPTRDNTHDHAFLRRTSRRRTLRPGQRTLSLQQLRSLDLEGGTGAEEDKALVDGVEVVGVGGDGDATAL